MVSRSETTFKNADICIGACNGCFVHKILSALLKPPFCSKWGPDLGGLGRGVIYFHFYILQKKHKDNVGVNTTHPRAVLAPGGVESVFLFQDNEKVKEPLLQSEAEASAIWSSESIMSILYFCGFVPPCWWTHFCFYWCAHWRYFLVCCAMFLLFTSQILWWKIINLLPWSFSSVLKLCPVASWTPCV